MTELIYLDNNATKPPSEKVIKTIVKYNRMPYVMNIGANTPAIQEVITTIDKYIYDIDKYTGGLFPIFTSGASESNSTIMNSFPYGHIIATAYEHPSLSSILNNRENVTFIKPNKSGIINPNDVVKAMKSNTVLVTIIHGNNEIPIVNDISEIFKLVKERNNRVFTHTDDTQLFAKCSDINIKDVYKYCDFVSMSSHKFGGPKGSGGLLISSYGSSIIQPLVHGKQQGNMRGGTEDQAGIISSYTAFKESLSGIANCITHKLVNHIHISLNTINYIDYLKNKKEGFIYFGDKNHINTVLICAYFPKKKICNIIIKQKLFDNNIIVSIGSACNTSDPAASKVLDSIDIPNELKKGILRISLSNNNTQQQLDKFINTLRNIIDEFDDID